MKKHMRLILQTVFLSIVFSPYGITNDENNTDAVTESSTVLTTANDQPQVSPSEDEKALEKWRKMEIMVKDFSSKAVKSILPHIVRSSGDITISTKCSKSLMKMISGFKEMKLWTYKMIDSSGKIPNGMFNGYLSSLGDFDGCLSVDVPGTNPFRGQYCTVFVRPPLPQWTPFHNYDEVLPLFVNFTKKETALDYLTMKAHVFFMVNLRTSICVPSTCSRDDIQEIVDNIVASAEFPWNISVPTCDVIEPLAFSKSDIAIICILSTIGVLAFAATIADVILNVISKEMKQKLEASSTALKCLMCFSTYTNTLRLLKKDTSPDSIKIFHGMKFITLLWVMLNHTYHYTNINLLSGVMNAREFGKEIAFQVVVNGFFNVETFFFISAVLVAYGRMKFTGKNINILLYIFRRVWRLTPPLMLIIATSMLTPHMGSGPGWKETVGSLIDKCKANWWTNLLFINNFYTSENMCFQWLWYIAVDTQLYLLALLVIVPLKSRPRFAFGINAVLFTVGILATAGAHVYYKQHPIPPFVYSHPKDTTYFVDYSFVRTYTHITTTCIGLCVGYILAARSEMKIPKMLNIFGWLCSMIFGLTIVYGVYDWNQGNIPGMEVSTIYMCTTKIVWALALSYITIACCTGHGGVITSILGWDGIVPISRLTYVAYIIHPIILLMFAGSTRTSLHTEHKTIVYRFLANMVASYGFAYVISLLFENPFMCLEKVMFSRKMPLKDSKNSEQETTDKHGTPKWSECMVSTINMKKFGNEVP